MKLLGKEVKIKIKKERLLFLAVIITMVLISKSLNLVLVNGSSMKPTYEDKNILTSSVIKDHNEEINIDDVVVFTIEENPNFLYIKRVVGTPKDILEIKNGKLYRNDKVVEDDFDKIEKVGILKNKITLKEDEYFCMGDNRNNSTDCRDFGPIHKDRISHKITGRFLGKIFN